MPKDTSPPRQPSTSFKSIASHAKLINSLSDSLRTSVQELNGGLNKLNIGVTQWVMIRTETTTVEQGFDVFESLDLGYAKVAGTWGIAIRHTRGPVGDPDNISEQTWQFNDAPRALRLEAVEYLPTLFEHLERAVKEIANNLYDKVKVADAFARDVAAYAEEFGLVDGGKDAE